MADGLERGVPMEARPHSCAPPRLPVTTSLPGFSHHSPLQQTALQTAVLKTLCWAMHSLRGLPHSVMVE